MSVLNNYAPKCFNDLVFETVELRSHFEDYARGRRGGSLLLYGTYGTGKSTLARILQQELHDLAQTGNEPECLEASLLPPDLDAAVTGQWNLEMSQGVRYPRVIINEVDQLGSKHQHSLRALMDQFPSFGFIFTTNHLSKVDPGIRDRCDNVEIVMPPPNAWIKMVSEVLAAKGIEVTDDQALRLATAGQKSIRDLGRVLDRLIAKLTITALGEVASVPVSRPKPQLPKI